MLQRIHGYNLIKHHQEALIPQQMYGIKPENGGNFVSFFNVFITKSNNGF